MCFMFSEDKFRNEMVFHQPKGNACSGMLGNLCSDMWEGTLIIRIILRKLFLQKKFFFETNDKLILCTYYLLYNCNFC